MAYIELLYIFLIGIILLTEQMLNTSFRVKAGITKAAFNTDLKNVIIYKIKQWHTQKKSSNIEIGAICILPKLISFCRANHEEFFRNTLRSDHMDNNSKITYTIQGK